MPAKLFETGRGTKGLIGLIILSASILASAFGMGMKIQKLIDELVIVTRQHQQIIDGITDIRGRCK